MFHERELRFYYDRYLLFNDLIYKSELLLQMGNIG